MKPVAKWILIIVISLILIGLLGFFLGEVFLTGLGNDYFQMPSVDNKPIACDSNDKCQEVLKSFATDDFILENNILTRCNNNICEVSQ